MPVIAILSVRGSGSGEGEHVNGREQFFQMLLLRHTESLFLINDHKAQIFEFDIL